MFNKLRLLLLSLLVYGIAACSNPLQIQLNQQHSEIWWVSAKTRTCYGVIEQECMLVKKKADAEWNNFYDQIEGFTYQPGFNYRLRIGVTPIEQPMADQSNKRYTLLDILEKNAAD